MRFQRKKVAAALACVLGGSVALVAAGDAIAQADIRVDVTGSNIRRLEGEGALPVQILNRSDIEKTGAQTASDLLQFVSAANSAGGVFQTQNVGATTFGAQMPSLRGLGGQATLVLINGKRMTQFSGEIQGVYGVDLSSIPFSAIERVEILKDGASAVYGSDAIAGVINFILRQDFTGAEVTGYYATPTRSGSGDSWNVSATAGWGDLTKDKFNVFVTAMYQDSEAVFQNQRDFSRTSIIPDIGLNGTSGNTFPANITTGNILSNAVLPTPGCAPSTLVGLPFYARPRCRYDPAQQDGVNSIPEFTQTSIFGSFRYQINPNNQFYATGSWSRNESNNVIQPTPISSVFFYGPNGDIPMTFLLPPTSPYYPTAAAIAAGVNGQPLNMLYRCITCGLRDSGGEIETWQIVTGLKGLVAGWDYDIDFAYSKQENTESVNNGYVDLPSALAILNSGVINPFGPSTPAALAAMDATQFRGAWFQGESDGWVLEGKVSRDLFKMQAGALAGAFGAQYGEQNLKQTPNPIALSGNISGLGGNFPPTDVSRDWWSVFAEFNIPIVKTFEANAAIRYDHYSDFGGTWNPKLSLRWNPTRQFLMRASWGTGFIAPALTQLYGANQSGVSVPGLSDPLRCPTTGSVDDCDTQFPVTFGGNPDLKPQTATQWLIGAVFEPAPGVSFGLDYFNIDVEDLFVNGFSTSAILADLNQYGYLVRRGPVQPAFPTLPGRIIDIDQRFINQGRTKIAGWDIDIQARSPQTAIGRFNFQLTGSYYDKYDVQQTDGSYAGFVSNQLFAANSGITPRYKQYATLTWTYGPWATTLGNLYQSSYIDWNTDLNGDSRRASSMSLWDLLVTYTGLKNWAFTLGSKNLFDTNPPVSNTQVQFQSGYDQSYYDAHARVIYGKITYSFK